MDSNLRCELKLGKSSTWIKFWNASPTKSRSLERWAGWQLHIMVTCNNTATKSIFCNRPSQLVAVFNPVVLNCGIETAALGKANPQRHWNGGTNVAPPCPPLMCSIAHMHNIVNFVKKKQNRVRIEPQIEPLIVTRHTHTHTYIYRINFHAHTASSTCSHSQPDGLIFSFLCTFP